MRKTQARVLLYTKENVTGKNTAENWTVIRVE